MADPSTAPFGRLRDHSGILSIALREPRTCAGLLTHYESAGLLYFDKLSNRIVEVSCGFEIDGRFDENMLYWY